MSLDALLGRARDSRARVVLAGGDDGLVDTIAGRRRIPEFAVFAVVGRGGTTPEDHPRLGAVASLLRSRKPNQVRDGIHALDLAADPLRLAAGLVALGDADAVVAGPSVSAETLVEAAGWTLDPPLDGHPVRAVQWLLLPNGSLFALADCVLAGELDAGEQAALAVAAAAAHARVGDGAPQVAFLADRQVRFRELANVLIFPGGAAGSLALRTARELTGARLLGPLLLGPAGVVMGVTEDADDEEMAGTVALAALVAAPAGI